MLVFGGAALFSSHRYQGCAIDCTPKVSDLAAFSRRSQFSQQTAQLIIPSRLSGQCTAPSGSSANHKTEQEGASLPKVRGGIWTLNAMPIRLLALAVVSIVNASAGILLYLVDEWTISQGRYNGWVFATWK
jgi:hypothetical protein